MRKCPMLMRMLMILVATVAMGSFAGETEKAYDGKDVELRPFGCEVSVNGEILYRRGGVLGTWNATMHLAGHRSHLHVAGTRNEIDRVRVHKLDSGRNLVTMLFKNPPAVGGDGAVLFVGTAIEDDKTRYYYGDIYESRLSHAETCEHEEWHVPNSDLWVHKGGFKFKAYR